MICNIWVNTINLSLSLLLLLTVKYRKWIHNDCIDPLL